MLSLHLNSTIPNFVATTTIGEINFYDFVGDSWVVLFSHPLDFTPVCTTELGKIVFQFDEFKKRNVKVIGLSCDELSSHLKWINDIKSYCLEYTGDFPFSIIADPSRELAIKLDMLDNEDEDELKNALTVRSLYIIDPSKKLRLAMDLPSLHRTRFRPGTKVLINSDVTDDEIARVFPNSKIVRTEMPSGRCYMHTILDYDS